MITFNFLHDIYKSKDVASLCFLKPVCVHTDIPDTITYKSAKMFVVV